MTASVVGEPWWVWLVTLVGLVVMLGLDLWVGAGELTPGRAVRRVLLAVSSAGVFTVALGLWGGAERAGVFVAAYLTEYSLSVDNLFVFLLIMTAFAVPRALQQRALLVGILVALVLRAGMIVAGTALLSRLGWVLYLFGALLLVTAVRVAVGGEDDGFREGRGLRVLRRLLPVTDGFVGDRSVLRRGGRWMVTPLLLVMVTLGFTDVLFALDSIPAVLGLTRDPYLVLTANAFALLGLRHLFFVLGAALRRLAHLSWALTVILAFIGVKLVLEALHENTVPFVNGGRPVAVPTITTAVSLAVIAGTLVVTVVADLAHSRYRLRHPVVEPPAARPTPPGVLCTSPQAPNLSCAGSPQESPRSFPNVVLTDPVPPGSRLDTIQGGTTVTLTVDGPTEAARPELLGRDEFRAELENAIKGREAKNASFSRAWAEGELTREHFARWAENHYHYVGPFADYLGYIYGNTPDRFTDAKDFTLQNMYEEELADIRHTDLLIKFGEACGTTRERIENPDNMNAVTRGLQSWCYQVSMREHFVVATAALVVGLESQVPSIYKKQIVPLRGVYGFTEDEIEFFDLHITSDEVHGERGYQIVLDHADTPELQQRCLAFVRWGAEMRFSYTRSLYDTYVAADLAA